MQKKWGGNLLKRVMAVTLAASMAVSLAACGGGGAAAKTSEAGSAPEEMCIRDSAGGGLRPFLRDPF